MIFCSAKEGKIGILGAIVPWRPILPFFSILSVFYNSRIQKRRFSFLLFSLAFFQLFFQAAPSLVQAADNFSSSLPAIPRLDSRDIVFKQYLADMEASRSLLFSTRAGAGRADEERARSLASSLTIYAYIPQDNDELFGIAARCNIPYSTLASINRVSHSEEMQRERALLLPSIPGIFVPETPLSDLEQLLVSTRADTGSAEGQFEGIVLSIPREGKTEKFRFFPGDDFSQTERIYFLNRGFRFPLQNFQLSSSYGPRVNPVTGAFGIHRGVDLSARENTEVFAVRDGTVADLGEDSVFGKYIIIRHDNNWVSFYGHLSSISTSLHAELRSGNLIGRVGSTGQSTGPHLHFELRQNGQSRDPARLLGIFREASR